MYNEPKISCGGDVALRLLFNFVNCRIKVKQGRKKLDSVGVSSKY